MTSCPKCELLDVDEASAKIKKNKKKQKEDKAKSRRKILWRIVFLFSLVGFTYQSYQFLKEYLSNPVVITGYVQTGVPQNFPSITVCSYSKYDKKNVFKKIILLIKYLRQGKLNEILPDTKPVRLADDGLNNMSCDWNKKYFQKRYDRMKLHKSKYCKIIPTPRICMKQDKRRKTTRRFKSVDFKPKAVPVISIFFKIKINFFKMPKNKYKRKSLNDLKITLTLAQHSVKLSEADLPCVAAPSVHSSFNKIPLPVKFCKKIHNNVQIIDTLSANYESDLIENNNITKITMKRQSTLIPNEVSNRRARSLRRSCPIDARRYDKISFNLLNDRSQLAIETAIVNRICLLVVKNVLTSHVEADQIHSSQRAQFLLLIKTLVLLLSEELFLTLPIELLNERKMNIYFQVSQKFDKQCSVISVTYSFLKARYMPDRIKRSIEWPRQPLKDKPNKDDSKALIDHKNMKSLRKIESATTIDERIELGQSAESVIYSCHFMGRVCDYKNFTHSYTYKYGNCWNFDPENEDGEPSKALEAGPMFGLNLDLYFDKSTTIELLDRIIGFRLSVHNRGEVPFPEDQGLDISLQKQTSVGIYSSSKRWLPPPYYSNCIDKDPSQYFKPEYFNSTKRIYTTQTVSKESYGENVNVLMPYLYFHGSRYDGQVCDVDNQTEICCMEQVIGSLRHGINCNCTIPCQEQLGRVKVFFESLDTRIDIILPKYQLADVFSNIGGQVGLWLGISLVALYEVGENFIISLYERIKSSGSRKR
ncbi:Amiloride-sensitive sodium channel subunit gamma [Nymphon striatum]|nr:Amiloride-sensitive sodium channel subunit gamma [Nymphon striatum]